MTFAEQVERQIAAFRDRPWPAWSARWRLRRVAWVEARRPMPGAAGWTPRRAFEVRSSTTWGSKPPTALVSETADEIVWDFGATSCPTVEACRTLGLDTRQACRAVYEKSTQALVSRSRSPVLRFLRDYGRLRPTPITAASASCASISTP